MQNQLLNTQLKSLMDSEEAQKKERLIKERLVYEENLKQKFLTEHLKDENTQLKYQLTTNENKWENLYNKTIDTFNKQLKDSEEAHRKELNNIQLEVEEHKKEVAKILKETEEAHRREMLENEGLRDEENIKHNTLTEKLQEEITQLKGQLTLAHEKQATERQALQDSVKNLYHKELNAREEIYEKRINKVISTFNKQLKDSEDHSHHEVQEHIKEELKKLENNEEALRKELHNLQLKTVDEHKKEVNKKLKDSEETHRKEFYDMQLKVEELKKEEAKKLEDTIKGHKKEIYNLQVKVEEHQKEISKTLEDTIEAHKREMLENIYLRDEEHIKHNALTDKLQEEIAHLKNQLTLVYEKQANERKYLQDSIKNIHHKELNAREEIFEKRINRVISTFNKQLKDSENHLQHQVQEYTKEEVKKLENNEEALRKELHDLQLKMADEHRKEVNTKLKDSEETHRKEFYDMQLKVEELRKEEVKKLEDTKEAHRKEMYNLQVEIEEHKREVTKTLKDSAEVHRRDMLENIHLRDEENIKHNALTEKLQKEIEQLKNQLTLVYETQATERKDLQDSIKNIYHKELIAREEIFEKRINRVIGTFNKQLKDSEDNLQHKVQEHTREEVKKLGNIEEVLRKELHDLQLKTADEHKKEVNEKLKDSKEAHRKEVYNLQFKVEEFKGEEAKKFKDSEETYRNNLLLIRKEVKSLEERFDEQNSLIESSDKVIVTEEKLMSRLEDLERLCIKKANAILEVSEEKSKKEHESIYKKIHKLQLEVDNILSNSYS